MNPRDLELLSSYLDGQLTPSDSARLESRFKMDGELVSALDDLRAARTLLRKLPKRRAPRNFTLTRKMVGLNPPLPRSYPAFRFATAVATLLFFFTFGVNVLAPQISQAPAFGIGGGGGAEAPAEPELFSQSVATEAPATEAPIFDSMPAAATEAPAATDESAISSADLAPQPTIVPTDSSARVAETPIVGIGGGADEVENQVPVTKDAASPAPIPSTWMIVFAVIAMIGFILMSLMRRSSINRWK